MRRELIVFLPLLAGSQGGCVVPEEDEAAAVFDRSRLHAIDLLVEKSDLSSLETDLDARVPCTVLYDGVMIRGAGIRQKGNTLVELSEKPSFSVKFDEFADTKLYGLNKILLNSSKQDPSFLREQLGADMYTRAGLPTARVAHAQLRLNGEDRGIYVVVESIDKDFLRLHFGEGNEEGNLYEGPCCGDFVEAGSEIELKDEDEGRSRDDLEALAEVVVETPDEVLELMLDQHLDLDGFITSYALEAALGHWDGYAYRANNYYLYHDPGSGRFVFIPHGMDRVLEEADFDPESELAALLPRRVRAIEALDAQFDEAFTRVVTEVWDEAAMAETIAQASAVVGSALAGAKADDDLAGFNAEVEALEETLALRRSLLEPSLRCGDGQLGGLETCDDGNEAEGDGCSARCRVEP
ncbi:CotH kinase family protein [Chondromyces apiculatus]|uniref:Lectin C-type domain protein n=1 Tax=Chondromyces apiculatus DSM 436 TaxID=1192034 RepID=A0A017T9K1_9BACT|nr:CotH kinase family protein [Chondromyces apiculatus]EYF05490.1 lectin C-type domain protein [Chondromyces apiculatus DSM 436]